MRFFDFATRLAFGAASIALVLLAATLIITSIVDVFTALASTEGELAPHLIDAIGYTIIAIAVFDVGKFLMQEETIHAREMRHAGEARRSLTKFISTIAIAIFLEALVIVFQTSKSDVSQMIYPTLLLVAGVLLLVGLGVYQRLSSTVEKEANEKGDKPGDDGPDDAD